MYAWFYKGSALAALPQIGLVLFLGVFVMVVVRVYWGARASSFDAAASLPFVDEAPVVRTPRSNAALASNVTSPAGDRHGH
jgi:cbb3-type cytochrome oxidase subunit 3